MESFDAHARSRPRAAFRTALTAGLLLLCAPLGARTDTATGAEAARAKASVAPDLSTFAEIHSATLADYESCQLKLTYMGGQTKRTSGLAAVSTLRSGGFELAPFSPFEHHGSYSNDSSIGDTLRVGPAELKAFLDAIAVHPALQDTTAPPTPQVSLMVLRGAPALCWEHITDSFAQGDTLFQLLHDALVDSTDRVTVHRFRHHMVGIRR